MTFNEALPYVLTGLAVLLLFVAFFYLASRKTTVVAPDKRDVLDEGAARAQRNQALIDAPTAPKAPTPPPAPVAAEPTPAPPPPAPPAPAPTPPPAPAPEPAPAPARTGQADNLTTIKGLGPKLATLLAEQGVTSFAQIAAWTDADVERIDSLLGRFKGRITRDNWVEQAKLLAAGDEAGFSAKFGQNG